MMAEKSKVKWGNCIGYVLLPFPLALQEDPLEYVRQAKATIDRKKHSFEAVLSFGCARLALKLLGHKVPNLPYSPLINVSFIVFLLIECCLYVEGRLLLQ